MSKTEIGRRYVLFVVSLFFAALGVAFTKHGELGVSPISSVANVLSCRFSSLSVIANVIMNSGEAFVKAVSDTGKKDFGNVKIIFDVLCVVISLVLSLLFFDFRIVGTREGTIISALLTGVVVKFFTGKLKDPLNAVLCRKCQESAV